MLREFATASTKMMMFIVMGPSVNLAARLMCSPTNPGILVDGKVQQATTRVCTFNQLPPVNAKGYTDPVPIFQPITSLRRPWGTLKTDFVGRQEEISRIVKMASDMDIGSPARFIHVTGESGIGKATLVVHAIEHIRNTFGMKEVKLQVAKHSFKESDSLLPFR